MTAKEKAKQIATAWVTKTGVINAASADINALCADIELALKEQDRDTRHACAEAVLGSADPHAACMNVRAV